MNDSLSQLAEEQVKEFPAIRSLDTLRILDIVMPNVRRLQDATTGWSVYRYTATIRELLRD